MGRTWVVLAVLMVSGLTGCGTSSAEDAAPAPEPNATPAPDPPFRLVPAVVGDSWEELGPHLARHGVVLGTVTDGDQPCLPEGQVLAQSPEHDTQVDDSSAVDVVVNAPTGACGGRLPPAADDLTRAAQLFLDFARGRMPYPPIDTPVNLLLGGHLTEVLPNSGASDHDQWRTCPEGGSYAGRVCPFSAVDLLREHTRVVITSQQPTHPCAHPAPLPGRTVTLTPAGEPSCVDYWAVQLGVNDVGQVTDVNVVLAEP